jgi:pimeloyl-ACP methyl ester carboxylesterase
MNGSPGSRLGPLPRERLLHELGARLITFDRPGYGLSDRLVSRVVAEVAVDVRAIADYLGSAGSPSLAGLAAGRTRSPALPCCPNGARGRVPLRALRRWPPKASTGSPGWPTQT